MTAADLTRIDDITQYPWRCRRDYLMLVAAVAMIDQELHPDELALLNRWMDQFKLPPKSREAVRSILEQKPFKRPELERRLSKTDLVYSLLLDLMGMAMADGVLMDKEIYLLRGIAKSLEIDPIDFNIMIEFVHSAYQAAQLDNPEPLYEHNIESAFQLMKQRKVRLFAHTLLCVSSPEYDQALKERWMRFVNGGKQAKRK